VDVTTPSGGVLFGELPEIVMDDATRTKARELLALWRAHHEPRQLPPRLTQQNGGPGAEASD